MSADRTSKKCHQALTFTAFIDVREQFELCGSNHSRSRKSPPDLFIVRRDGKFARFTAKTTTAHAPCTNIKDAIADAYFGKLGIAYELQRKSDPPDSVDPDTHGG